MEQLGYTNAEREASMLFFYLSFSLRNPTVGIALARRAEPSGTHREHDAARAQRALPRCAQTIAEESSPWRAMTDMPFPAPDFPHAFFNRRIRLPSAHPDPSCSAASATRPSSSASITNRYFTSLAQHPLVRVVDLPRRDHLDLRHDAVLGAEIEHLLRSRYRRSANPAIARRPKISGAMFGVGCGCSGTPTRQSAPSRLSRRVNASRS